MADQPRDEFGRFTADGMHNVLTGLGDPARDKATGARLCKNPDLSRHQIDALYQDDGLAAKIVDLPSNDLTRAGVELRDFDGDLQRVESAMEDLGLLCHISDLYRWGSCYGGAIMGAAIDDGLPPNEPLDMNRIQRVRGFFVLDRHVLSPIWITGRASGEPDGYIIGTDGPEVEALQGRVVHRSRVRTFCGTAHMTRWQKQLRMGWGLSVYQRVWDRFRRLLAAHGYGETILQDISVDVFLISGLVEAFTNGNEDLVRKRLMALQMGKDVLHGVALDAGTEQRKPEGYVTQTRSVAGVTDLMGVFADAVTWCVPIPKSIFRGETTGGLNTGSNSGEIRSYYAWVGGEQKERATGWLNWQIELLFASKEGPTSGNVPSKWTTHWHSLWAPTEAEEADLRLKIAQADKVYFDIGAASADDVAYTRIEKGSRGDLEQAPVPDDPPELDPAELDVPALPEGGAPPVAGAGVDVQQTALNGAQITAMMDLATQIADEQLPLEFGIALLPVAFPGTVKSEADARKILASLATFVKKKSETPSSAPGRPPGGAPPQAPPAPPATA